MYVYYIVMKMYVFICINIFSPFYCLCIINKTKISIPFTILFHEILHSYNLFLSSEGVFKGHKHPLIY
jgi:hypothetical protein